jgi:hypothetical protein
MIMLQVDKDGSGAPRKRNEPPKQPTAKLVKDKPEKILGVTKVQGELHFLVKYKNKAGPLSIELILAVLVALLVISGLCFSTKIIPSSPSK